MDDSLLSALDRDPEVQRAGRSAAIRAAVQAWLASRREAAVDAAYRRGYADGAGLGEELQGWEQEGEWPAE